MLTKAGRQSRAQGGPGHLAWGFGGQRQKGAGWDESPCQQQGSLGGSALLPQPQALGQGTELERVGFAIHAHASHFLRLCFAISALDGLFALWLARAVTSEATTILGSRTGLPPPWGKAVILAMPGCGMLGRYGAASSSHGTPEGPGEHRGSHTVRSSHRSFPARFAAKMGEAFGCDPFIARDNFCPGKPRKT